MRVLSDRDIFGDPYEPAPQPPPYEDWETQGKHIKGHSFSSSNRSHNKKPAIITPVVIRNIIRNPGGVESE
ncbi:hypothetical protein LCGC14_1770660 [marine sediment metagenome]|uniref:Uncharacterized protein n=1 Tax=marine sediment metagenome TaxID=412755 RepID=A0A0F9HKX5_9ZZZZ